MEIEWKDGVHIAGTAIWCDALRARDICFVSAAGAIRRARHGQLIATRETLALLDAAGPPRALGSDLSVPLGRPFTLGRLRLELIGSGYGVGAASLAVNNDDRRVLYCGAVASRGGVLAAPADARASDVLVIRASARAERTLPDPARLTGDLASFCAGVAAQGTALALVPSILRGLDVAYVLTHAGLDVSAQRPIHHAAQKLRAVDLRIPPLRRADVKRPRAGRVIVWLEGGPKEPPPGAAGVAIVAGPRREGRDGVYFPWPGEPDESDLMSYIETVRPESVYLTGTLAVEIAKKLDSPKRRVVPLTGPEQMRLFP